MTPNSRQFGIASGAALFVLLSMTAGCGPVETSPDHLAHATSSPGSDLASPASALSMSAKNIDPLSRIEPTADAETNEVSVRAVTPDQFKQALAALKGKVVLVDFWATYCLPCRAKFPKTLALSKKYSGQGLAVISMSMDSPDPKYQKEVIKFLRQQNSRVTNLENSLEDTDAAFTALQIDGGALPHYKVFDRHGVLRKKFGGDPDHPFDEKDIEAAVVAALQQK